MHSIEKAITPRTKAIIGVHLYGQPFDVDAVRSICTKHNLFLVEDAAQAQGTRYKNSVVGTLGDISCYSFYPGKNLGACGEGGAIVTNNDNYAAQMKSLRNHGSVNRYYHDEVGYNYRMGGYIVHHKHYCSGGVGFRHPKTKGCRRTARLRRGHSCLCRCT